MSFVVFRQRCSKVKFAHHKRDLAIMHGRIDDRADRIIQQLGEIAPAGDDTRDRHDEIIVVDRIIDKIFIH